jgi:ABC-type sugar transport system ATPase subunit
VQYLSGGNQQKGILSKWLASDSDVFIFDEPTRGIDVEAKASIHDMIRGLTKQGKAVLMISSELPEVIGMSDPNFGDVGWEFRRGAAPPNP